MLSLLIELLIQMWWLIALIASALVYAARVDVRYAKQTKSYMDMVNDSIMHCHPDRDTF